MVQVLLFCIYPCVIVKSFRSCSEIMRHIFRGLENRKRKQDAVTASCLIGKAPTSYDDAGPYLVESDIKSRIHIVHVFLVQLLPQQFHSFSESLEMNDFPFP